MNLGNQTRLLFCAKLFNHLARNIIIETIIYCKFIFTTTIQLIRLIEICLDIVLSVSCKSRRVERSHRLTLRSTYIDYSLCYGACATWTDDEVTSEGFFIWNYKSSCYNDSRRLVAKPSPPLGVCGYSLIRELSSKELHLIGGAFLYSIYYTLTVHW